MNRERNGKSIQNIPGKKAQHLEPQEDQRGLSRSRNSAVFLDRDGTLNEDPGYLNDPSLLRLLPGVREGLKLLKDSGFFLVVVTNQSGVEREKITISQLSSIHRKMDELIGFPLDSYQVCTHLPESACSCRKPSPLLLQRGAEQLQIDLATSFMVGDKTIDLEAGRRAGCRGRILVSTGAGLETLKTLQADAADFVARDFFEVAQWILKQHQSV